MFSYLWNKWFRWGKSRNMTWSPQMLHIANDEWREKRQKIVFSFHWNYLSLIFHDPMIQQQFTPDVCCFLRFMQLQTRRKRIRRRCNKLHREKFHQKLKALLWLPLKKHILETFHLFIICGTVAEFWHADSLVCSWEWKLPLSGLLTSHHLSGGFTEFITGKKKYWTLHIAIWH